MNFCWHEPLDKVIAKKAYFCGLYCIKLWAQSIKNIDLENITLIKGILQMENTTSLMLGTRKSHGSSFSSSGNELLYSSCSSLNFSCTKCNCQRQHMQQSASIEEKTTATLQQHTVNAFYHGSKFIQHSAHIERDAKKLQMQIIQFRKARLKSSTHHT